MPDHVHALVWFSETGQLSRFMHGWKRKSSFRIRERHRREQLRYFEGFGQGDRFWQKQYHSFEIYSAGKLEEKLNYMHLNPVRRGLVACAVDWRWSSARWYLQGRSVGVPIQRIK